MERWVFKENLKAESEVYLPLKPRYMSLPTFKHIEDPPCYDDPYMATSSLPHDVLKPYCGK